MSWESVGTDIRRYIDIRFEEARLRVAKSVSSIVSQIASFLIVAILATILVCLLLVALMQWLNELLGMPWGTLIAAGGLVIIIAAILLFRKRLFAGVLGKGIAAALGSDSNNPEKDLSELGKERKNLEGKIDKGNSGLFGSAVNGVVFATSLIRKIRGICKSSRPS